MVGWGGEGSVVVENLANRRVSRRSRMDTYMSSASQHACALTPDVRLPHSMYEQCTVVAVVDVVSVATFSRLSIKRIEDGCNFLVIIPVAPAVQLVTSKPSDVGT